MKIIEPLYDHVVLRRVEISEELRGGIVIPEVAQQKPTEAMVVAVGTGKADGALSHVHMHVAVGDRVILGKYSGTEIKVDGDEYLVVREDEILGIIRFVEPL